VFKSGFGVSPLVYNKTVDHLNQPKESRQKHWMSAAKVVMADLPELLQGQFLTR
jgi:hypothetical protein